MHKARAQSCRLPHAVGAHSRTPPRPSCLIKNFGGVLSWFIEPVTTFFANGLKVRNQMVYRLI